MTGLSRPQFLGWLLTAFAVAAIAVGIVVTGSPGEQRRRRVDERRIRDLQNLSSTVDVYWTRHARVPASLEELRAEFASTGTSKDPDTGAPYEYRPVDATTYELCATFERNSREDDRTTDYWSHAAGRQCFRREARKIR